MPHHRVVFDGGEGVAGLAFEWLVEALDGGICIVRLVNTGFGSGEESDGQYDGMAEGWPLFLQNLKLHLAHFGGQTATASLPMAIWPGTRDKVWAALNDALGLPDAPNLGDRIDLAGTGRPRLAGIAVDATAHRISLLVDKPMHGTAVVAVEGSGDHSSVSIWSYLYGPDAASVAARDTPRWQSWLDELGERTE